MNKKGNVLLASLFAIMFFIAGITLINMVKDDISTTRVTLDCANASGITDGNKITCLVLDMPIIYGVLVILSVVGGFFVEGVK